MRSEALAFSNRWSQWNSQWLVTRAQAKWTEIQYLAGCTRFRSEQDLEFISYKISEAISPSRETKSPTAQAWRELNGISDFSIFFAAKRGASRATRCKHNNVKPCRLGLGMESSGNSENVVGSQAVSCESQLTDFAKRGVTLGSRS